MISQSKLDLVTTCILLMVSVFRLAADKPSQVVLRRLTHSQYNNTVRDLLGNQSRPADQFSPEAYVNGFKNQAAGQSIPPLLAEAYSLAAEKLAKNAFRGGDVNRLIPCRPASAADSACRDRFIQSFGLRAFRRPLDGSEKRSFAGLFTAEARKTNDFLRGAQIVVETMLQSPKFLFRVERGGSGTGYEVASRLSYFLWDTTPDAELLGLAESGGLETPAGIERAARHMLNDPRARQGLDEFMSQWLRFDQVVTAVKDRRVFPEFTPELAVAMTEETRRLIGHMVWGDRDFREIFTADYTFISTDLAKLYDLPQPAAEFDLVKFPGSSDRTGILGHASFLTSTSKPEETSPTARGLFIREHFLCQRVPDPPPGTNANLPNLEEDKPQTNRGRLDLHKSSKACASCHQLIDPIGFGLEKFDAIGKRREQQTMTFAPSRAELSVNPTLKPKTVKLDIDAKGTVSGTANSDFSSPRELGLILSRSAECQKCIVKQVFRYAFGRQETAEDDASLARSVEAFRQSGYRFKELMVAVAASVPR